MYGTVHDVLVVCSPQAIVSKIALDQSFMTPIGTSLFFAAAKLMDMQPHAVVPTIKVCP